MLFSTDYQRCLTGFTKVKNLWQKRVNKILKNSAQRKAMKKFCFQKSAAKVGKKNAKNLA